MSENTVHLTREQYEDWKMEFTAQAAMRDARFEVAREAEQVARRKEHEEREANAAERLAKVLKHEERTLRVRAAVELMSAGYEMGTAYTMACTLLRLDDERQGQPHD